MAEQKSYLIENFHSKEDFKLFTNPKTLKDMKRRFEWLEIQKNEYPTKKPQYAIGGQLFFDILPSNSKDLTESKEVSAKKVDNLVKCSFCYKQEIFFEESLWYYGKPLKICQDCYSFFFEGKAKHFCSKCNQPFIPRFEWATQCLECWKIAQIDPQKKNLIETIFDSFRKKAVQNDSPKLQKQRMEFVDKLQMQNTQNLELTELYLCEETEESSIHSSFVNSQYFSEYQFCNTRRKMNNESLAEFDNISLEQAREGICFIALRLLEQNQSFLIFYAEGQRSPHIRVYKLDFLNDLTEFQRIKAVTLFWRNIAGEFYKFLDKSVWADNHFVPLEYAPHWKYSTPYVCYGSSNE